MSHDILKIGTRGSKLALWQANHVAAELQNAWPGLEVQVCVIKTKGDKILDVALSKIGDKGLFTKEIENALEAGEVDMCVHSMKDVPTKLASQFQLAAILKRADPRDVLVCPEGLRFEDLPQGVQIGTGSLRRVAQLQALRPDIQLGSVRGNVATRIGKAQDGTFAAVVLAASGIQRLGLEDKITQFFETDQLIPAVGQGAIGVEICRDDERVARYLEAIACPDAMRDVFAERVIMEALEGGCQVPIGAYARQEEDAYRLDAFVASLDGSRMVKVNLQGSADQAHELALQAVEMLKEEGAVEILEELR